MNTSSFVRYLAKITIELHFPLYNGKIYTDVDFITPFSLRQLKANVIPFRYFPSKFVNIDITSYEILNPSLPNTEEVRFHPRCCHNYQQIIQMIIRNVIYILGFEFYLNNYKYE